MNKLKRAIQIWASAFGNLPYSDFGITFHRLFSNIYLSPFSVVLSHGLYSIKGTRTAYIFDSTMI